MTSAFLVWFGRCDGMEQPRGKQERKVPTVASRASQEVLF